MSNITKITNAPPRIAVVEDLKVGGVGYVLPWAIRHGNLNTSALMRKRQVGTYNLKVTCVDVGLYEVEYTDNYYDN